MTWKEIKIAALQRMFAIPGDDIVMDDTTQPYLLSMPAAANEALQLLSTAGKFLIKYHELEQDGTQKGIQRYDLRALCESFYSVKDNQIFVEDENGYRQETGFVFEGDSILVLPGERAGKWRIYYNAYPVEIVKDTPDDYELPLDPEVAVLIPLYIASQLYKDDDISQSVQFRNEFETAREELRGAVTPVVQTEFVSKRGWW